MSFAESMVLIVSASMLGVLGALAIVSYQIRLLKPE
jgi:hypothetical protein